MKAFGIGLLAILGILAFTWIIMGNDFFLYKVFAPQREEVRRQVFEETKSYNQGMIQELQNMQFQYVATKDSSAKASLASIILQRAADYPEDRLPADLRSFIQKLKDERTGSRY